MNSFAPATVATPGSWASPLTAPMLAQAGTRIGISQVVGDDVWWQEIRPSEGGRSVIVSRAHGDVLPAPWSARTRVHEYGGKAWLGLNLDGTTALLFSHHVDSRVYLLVRGESPVALTPASPTGESHRYADFIRVGQEVWCVREIVRGHEVERALVAVSLTGDGLRVLESSSHFYAHPRLAPDGRHLAWIAWEHPQMPWDGTTLRVATIVESELADITTVAGSESESILCPEWADSDNVYAIADASGWWNIWRFSLAGGREHIIDDASDWAGPLWVLGMQFFLVLPSGELLGLHGTPAHQHLAVVDPVAQTFRNLPSEQRAWSPYLQYRDGRAYATGSGPASLPGLYEIDIADGKVTAMLAETKAPVDARYFTNPRGISVHGEGGRTVHAIFHPAHNPDFTSEEIPPLLVGAHGGPTAHETATLNLGVAYYTSRGFNYVDVNYGGSTGYGRAYRDVLKGQWGVVDHEDVLSVVSALIDQGIAHPDRILIEGGSAGGFTVLNALMRSRVFAAGSSHFGVADLVPFTEITHDFEARYLDQLIGPYPERADLYIERSPLTYAEHLTSPLIIFQGLDDKIVPPSQSEIIRDVCVRKGIKHRYLAFEGEGHGFVRAASIIETYEAELSFFGEVLGFAPALS